MTIIVENEMWRLRRRALIDRDVQGVSKRRRKTVGVSVCKRRGA